MTGIDSCICSTCLNNGKAKLQNILDKDLSTIIGNIPKPKEIKEFLDKYIIGQDDVKEKVAVAVYNHYKRIWYHDDTDVEIDKSNLLLVGETGTGKTMIARTIAKMLNVPFAIADATVLTESGYVGEDVESVLVRLYQAADYDIERTQCGIVFIDEIDKIARKSANASITRDVSGEGVQQGLLKLLEDSIVSIPPKGGRKHPEQPLVQINTKNILFICAGAFVGIEDIVKRRVNKRAIGYSNDVVKENTEEYLDNLTHQDFKRYGLIPEILGRLPVICHTNPLTKSDLLKILTTPQNSLLKQYQQLFLYDGIILNFTNQALDTIVEHAMEHELGARGLRSIMERVMQKIMYDAPSDVELKKVKIDKKYVMKALKEHN